MAIWEEVVGTKNLVVLCCLMLSYVVLCCLMSSSILFLVSDFLSDGYRGDPMKLKKTELWIVSLLVLGVIAIAAVAMGDGKTARRAVQKVGGNGRGYAPDPSIVAAEDAKINPAKPGLAYPDEEKGLGMNE